MEQIVRIARMERILTEARETVSELSNALEKYRSLQDRLEELEAYYGSCRWRQDFDDDSAGKLPGTLLRGVLSEDGVYHLLEDDRALREQMRALLEQKQRESI